MTIRNPTQRTLAEVVQSYISDQKASVRVPRNKLVAYQRVELGLGKTRKVKVVIEAEALALVDEEGKRRVEPGSFRLTVGGASPGVRAPLFRSSASATPARSSLGQARTTELNAAPPRRRPSGAGRTGVPCSHGATGRLGVPLAPSAGGTGTRARSGVAQSLQPSRMWAVRRSSLAIPAATLRT